MAVLAQRVKRIIKSHEKKALLGLVSISPEEFNYLVSEFDKMLHTPEKFKIQERYFLTTMTLIGFNMYQFTGNRYWEELDEFLDFKNPVLLRLKCVKYFESYCNNNLLSLHKKTKKTMYRESIQMHTIIAGHQFNKFIPIVMGLYMKDLEEDTSDEVVDELLNHLSKIFSQYDGQEVIISEYRGSMMSLTNQQLPQSFKHAFLLNYSSVAGLIKRYFIYLEALRLKRPIEFRNDNYHDKLFKSYLPEIERQLEEEVSVIEYKGGGGKKQFRRPFYRLQKTPNGVQLGLIVPKQLILPGDISEEIKITFYEEKKKVMEEELEANPGTLFWKTFQKEIILNYFYPRLNYKIMSKNITIYDSFKTLMYPFLLLNVHGEQITATQLRNDETYFLITEKDAEVETYETTSENIYKENNYLRYELIFNEETEIFIDGILLSTSFKEQTNGFPISTKYGGARIYSQDTEYQLIKSTSFFYFTCSNGDSLSDYHIMLNGKILEEKNIASVTESFLLGDGSGRSRHIINFTSLIVNDGLTQEIRIQKKGAYIASFKSNYILVKDLEWRFEKDFYTRESSAKIVKLYSDSLQLNLNSERNRKVEVNKGVYREPFFIQDKEFWIEVAIPIISIRVNDNESNKYDIKIKDKYFHLDFPFEQLTLSIPGQTFEVLCTMNNTIKKMHIKRKDKFSIVNLKPFISGRQANIHYFSMQLNGNSYSLFDVYFEESVHNIEIRYTPPNKILGGLVIGGEYIGESELCLDVFRTGGEFFKSYTNIQPRFHDPNLDLDFGIYQVELYTNIPNFFDDKDDRKILHTQELIYGDEFVLKNHFRRAQTIEAVSFEGQYNTDRLFFENFEYISSRDVYKAQAFFCIRDWNSGREKIVYLDENPIYFQEINKLGDDYIIEPEDSHGELMVIDVQSKKINPREANSSNDYHRYKVIERLIIRIL